ncbi:SGNH/GDSL hydrolase family protein [Aequorivita sp. SDUM287046]|uniref:SGNH/GDSL hydrolase family protein n=1 Tax=Aequorivita aurantiaca TaxID=3053356 RepID=A0ABT8DDQ7_9FLAO|nr:SGNH/GDSL hydrolase family protein [Aequorivita aurantiaca]MDN3722787.1 SGNH/GDSL hydrolase family protein [Aequorivita aurantiaca]
MINGKLLLLLLTLTSLSCGISKPEVIAENITQKYLALGDSYTIGESVCGHCNYPKQLTDSLNNVLKAKTSVKIIAKTGWTTTDLLGAIAAENPPKDYDLVTLLIGVNNQYQGKSFSVYEEEFPKLLDMAIAFAKGKNENVIVLSIPDYAFTPFGQKSGKGEKITSELKRYNAFAERISKEKNVHFENITPITQQGLENPKLVASDGLHPSAEAYKKFVENIFQKAAEILR